MYENPLLIESPILATGDREADLIFMNYLVSHEQTFGDLLADSHR